MGGEALDTGTDTVGKFRKFTLEHPTITLELVAYICICMCVM